MVNLIKMFLIYPLLSCFQCNASELSPSEASVCSIASQQLNERNEELQETSLKTVQICKVANPISWAAFCDRHYLLLNLDLLQKVYRDKSHYELRDLIYGMSEITLSSVSKELKVREIQSIKEKLGL